MQLKGFMSIESPGWCSHSNRGMSVRIELIELVMTTSQVGKSGGCATTRTTTTTSSWSNGKEAI